MADWILSIGAAVHGGNLISLERARDASSRAVNAHLSGGGGCSLGQGLADHHGRVGRKLLYVEPFAPQRSYGVTNATERFGRRGGPGRPLATLNDRREGC